MRPVTLTMQAFGSYGKKTTIDFTKPNQNLFLITGDTGAGKTTIFDAMVFALYGETSSLNNKKSGAELQSQYADLALSPYVEFCFMEEAGGQELLYTVRRTPRHVRPKKRGEGVMEQAEQVSLILPDGQEYPAKETNAKLIELIGLTKEQFMQVAMIAQGEFMELLRAKSDDKKVVFRKLFHTEIYQDIVDELFRRKKEMQKEMGQIKTICQSEAGHIVVPSTYEKAELLEEKKHAVMAAQNFSITELEQLLALLEEMLAFCETKRAGYETDCSESAAKRDQARDIVTKAKATEALFAQLEQAQEEQKQLAGQEADMQKKQQLAQQIEAAYEVDAVRHRLMDAKEIVSKMRDNQEHLRSNLPDMQQKERDAQEAYETAKKEQDAARQEETRVTERAERSILIFDKLLMLKQQLAVSQSRKEQKEQEQAAKEQELQKLKEQETQLQQALQHQAENQNELTKFEIAWQQGKECKKDLLALEEQQKETALQEEKKEEAKQAYISGSRNYQSQNEVYEQMRTAFFDAQAGLLAKEYLKEGCPCPVCGSLSHPAPCVLSEEQQAITRERLDKEEGVLLELREKQEELAAKAKSAQEVLEEKQAAFSRMCEQAFAELKTLTGQPAETIEEAKQVYHAYEEALQQRGDRLKEQQKQYEQMAETYAKVQEERSACEEMRQTLQRACEEAQAQYAHDAAAYESSKNSAEYASREDAVKAKDAAVHLRKEKETGYTEKEQQLQTIRTKIEQGQALLSRYEEELPEHEKREQEQQLKYEEILKKAAMPEEEIKELTNTYSRESAKEMAEQFASYLTKVATAKRLLESTTEALKGETKPDLSTCRQAYEEAEQEWKRQQEQYQQFLSWQKENKAAYDSLRKHTADRSAVLQKHQQAETLYQLLSGNVSGSRMDLETFVQRYYLERILYAANERFQTMSAGQYELRMCDLSQAGEGRNRGLDLMVYSYVTGKEREVRTLSGGESFMAALSLALGLADLIEQTQSSIHLDVMFIDEGFGSLDEQSRGQAVRVLKEMAGGNKMIGLISHVSELKQEMEDQLLVTKTETGSHVTWQIS